MTMRAVIAVAGLLLLMPATHFEVSAAFASKAPGRGEVAVTFLGKDPDVHINEVPAPRLKLEPGQALQEVAPSPAPAGKEGGAPSNKYLDITWPVVFPVTVARPAPGPQTVKASVTYFYCSKREGWCRKGVAPVEFPVTLP